MKKLIIIFVIISVSLITALGCTRNSPTKTASYADVFTLNGIHYCGASDEVITDEKVIDTEVGIIKVNIVESGVSTSHQMKDGEATFLKVNTKVYSLKSIDTKEAVAAQHQGKWLLYKAMKENNSDPLPSGNGISDESYKAAAIIIEKIGNANPLKIEDKEKIKKVLDGIKIGVQTKETINYPEGNMYIFYFVVPDKNGIGQIVHKYYLNFQDLNLNGYIRRFNDTYKVDSNVSKLITEPFGSSATIYDSKLGGKQQIYDIFADGKFILRKVVKEAPQEKFNVKVLKLGEEIWQNGNRVKDTLAGKYKVEVFMKDTKLQEKITNVLASKTYKLPGVLAIYSSTTDEGNSSVLYLSYDDEPALFWDESADSFVLVNKK